MAQGSGRYHLESVELCFVGDDLPFPGGYCFAGVCIVVPVVAELYFLYREKVICFQVRVCVNLTGYVLAAFVLVASLVPRLTYQFACQVMKY